MQAAFVVIDFNDYVFDNWPFPSVNAPAVMNTRATIEQHQKETQ
jgi:hypothetical protein